MTPQVRPSRALDHTNHCRGYVFPTFGDMPLAGGSLEHLRTKSYRFSRGDGRMYLSGMARPAQVLATNSMQRVRR